MTFLAFLSLGSLLLVLQTTLLQLLPGWMGSPDLLFLLIIFLAVRLELFPGAVLTLLLGLLMDIFSGIFLGVYPLSYLLTFFAIKGTAKTLALDEPGYQPVLAVVSYLLANTILYLATIFLAEEGKMIWSWGILLRQTIILAAISYPLFNFFLRIHQLATGSMKPRLSSFHSRSRNRFKI